MFEFLSLNPHGRSKWDSAITKSLPTKFRLDHCSLCGGSLPTVIHEEVGISFKLVFGGIASIGCSEAEEHAARMIEAKPNNNFQELRPVMQASIDPFLLSIAPLLVGECNSILSHPQPEVRGWASTPVRVSYPVAQDLADRMGCRIPTEAEWEYAARAYTRTLFPWGDKLPHDEELAPWLCLNYAGNAAHTANDFGFHGIFSGEWCSDLWQDSHCQNTVLQSSFRVIKGGGSMFWPWQGCQEWVWCMPSMRMSSECLFDDGKACFRLARSLAT